MDVPEGYAYKGGLLQFARKTKTRFTNLIENERACLGSIKTQFGLLVKFSIIRDPETILGPLFLQADSSPVWPKQDFQRQTFRRTLFAQLDNEVCLKGKNPNARGS